MQMKSLKTELDAVPFDRSFRPPRPTPLGLQVVADALQVVEVEAALRSRCAQSDQLVGAVQIGFVPSMAVRALPRFLKSAKQVAPNTSFRGSSGLSESLCKIMVRHGQLDAALVTDIPDATHKLHCEEIAGAEMVIVARADLETSNLEGLIAKETFLHFMPRSGIGRLTLRFAPHRLLQAVDAQARAVRSQGAAPARLRCDGTGPHHPGADRVLVRQQQPGRSG